MQVKHWGCTEWGPGVACVCGVAMREGEVIIAADMCHNDSAINDDVSYITYNAKDLPDDAGVTVTDSGITFKVTITTALLSHEDDTAVLFANSCRMP